MSLLAAHANCRPPTSQPKAQPGLQAKLTPPPSQPKTRPRLQAKPTPSPSKPQAGLTLNQNRSILQPKQQQQQLPSQSLRWRPPSPLYLYKY